MAKPSCFLHAATSGPRGALIALFAIGSLAGCSFIAVKPPPKMIQPGSATIDCTDSRVMPWVDTLLGVDALATGITEFVISCPGEADCNNAKLGVALLATGAIYTASSIWGHRAVSACRRTLADPPVVVSPPSPPVPPAPPLTPAKAP